MRLWLPLKTINTDLESSIKLLLCTSDAQLDPHLQRIISAQHHLVKPYNHPSSAQPVLDKKKPCRPKDQKATSRSSSTIAPQISLPSRNSKTTLTPEASAQPGPVACSYAAASTEPTYGATTASSSSRARKPQKSPGRPSIAATRRPTANIPMTVATRLPIKSLVAQGRIGFHLGLFLVPASTQLAPRSQPALPLLSPPPTLSHARDFCPGKQAFFLSLSMRSLTIHPSSLLRTAMLAAQQAKPCAAAAP
jgi:hypothetical protein